MSHLHGTRQMMMPHSTTSPNRRRSATRVAIWTSAGSRSRLTRCFGSGIAFERSHIVANDRIGALERPFWSSRSTLSGLSTMIGIKKLGTNSKRA